ncbi:MAG: CopG family transcriptional regulator [Caldisphaera sp.]|jgi:Arc/MetJ-type ribon-helix-helix transcriptional regulator|nr:CopG family transcriptional regulator [Caldisphaera sp.]PMP60509.1 MAG: CopG family transcriptional regulator [Caldisphaera sp.]PMP90524.1 MAG: CopG family transcriptional regulator [Caldisphaera sp.]
MSQEKVSINISKDLYEKAKKYIESQGTFNSVEELVEFMINELISQSQDQQVMSKEDEEKVKDRLKRLGYL